MKSSIGEILFSVCGTGETAAAYMRVPYNGGQRRNASHEALDWQKFLVSYCEPFMDGTEEDWPSAECSFPKCVRADPGES